ncbi:undecaprenyldiphospho-muramoylpentapeptide beta-N-acetylglucosaminyltransferase [Xanthomonadaceae bacterium XH05]|nr:undecaprenyldiphospho-muramoylpentapeptide beta-N-acetylglucosaminyltransferase [Xanthomonadaceae bacterium XH05]
MSAPVAILAGGTGGHIFPGLAVAQALGERGVPVLWIGAHGRMETRLVPSRGYLIETIDIAGLRGKGPLALMSAPFRLMRAVWQARAILRKAEPRAVISFGGFAAGPGGLAAWLARLPLLVHEQNSRPGVTNRVLSRLACRVLEGFPGSFPAHIQAQTVGNPVRADIATLPSPGQRLAGRDGALRVLVLGGSQGARALNQSVPQALAAQSVALDVLHQCGESQVQSATDAYAGAGVVAQIVPFIEDMAGAYAWADVVVCRAGALTLAEICAAGIASVLVPLPSAADDHQTFNAEHLVSHGAAVRVAEGEGFRMRLTEAIAALAVDPALRLNQAAAARELAMPDAAQAVADAVLEEARA